MIREQMINELSNKYQMLDSELDHMTWRSEVGLEVDMINWYRTIGKMEKIQTDICEIKQRTAKTNEAIARADAIIDELRATLNIEADPFEPCDPPVEPEYDPALEWFQMTSAMRRGE